MKTKISPSLKKITTYLFVFAASVCLVAISFVLYYVNRSHTDSYEKLKSTLSEQSEFFGKQLMNTSNYLLDTLMNDSDVEAIKNNDDKHKNNIAARKLQNSFYTKATNSEYAFNYYFYCPYRQIRAHYYISDADYPINAKIESFVTNLIDMAVYEPSISWNYYAVDNKLYLLKTYRYEGAYMTAWISTSKISETLSTFITDGSVIPLDEELSPIFEKDEEIYNSLHIIDGEIKSTLWGDEAFLLQLSGSYISYLICGSPIIDYGNIFMICIFLFIILAIVIFCAFYTIRYYKQYIEIPLAKMQNHVAEYVNIINENKRKTGFSELNEAAEAFENVYTQLEKLKIESYEEKLLLSKTQLEYYQLQIKPHFFVNCFSILFSMAQKKEFERIQELCLYLSNYVRYLFSDSQVSVRIVDEIKHINDYLSIQNIRHRSTANLTDSIDSNYLNCRIPPLVLFTFVENSIKHSQSDNLSIEISVEEFSATHIKISVLDNGKGFSEENLNKFNITPESFTAVERSSHVGIANIYSRLYMVFGNDFTISFENGDNGGALVSIRIPKEKGKEENEYIIGR